MDECGDEIRKEAIKKMTDGMSPCQKVIYFWYYYKWHYMFIAAVIIFGIWIARTAYLKASSYTVLSLVATDISGDTDGAQDYLNGFINAYDYSDGAKLSLNLSIDVNDSSDIKNAMSLQLIAALFSGGSVDIFMSDEELFAAECERNAFMDLEEFLPEETFEKYKDIIYYSSDSYGNERAYGIQLSHCDMVRRLGIYNAEDKPIIGVGSQYGSEQWNIINMLEYILGGHVAEETGEGSSDSYDSSYVILPNARKDETDLAG